MPETLEVDIEGPDGDIGPVSLDAGQIRKGYNYFLMTHNQVTKPPGVRVLSIRPALLTLEAVPRED